MKNNTQLYQKDYIFDNLSFFLNDKIKKQLIKLYEKIPQSGYEKFRYNIETNILINNLTLNPKYTIIKKDPYFSFYIKYQNLIYLYNYKFTKFEILINLNLNKKYIAINPQTCDFKVIDEKLLK